MTRFIYLSDTHIGASGDGYHQQPPYPNRIKEIVATLSMWMEENGPIDFILHGGDLTDTGSTEAIREAVHLFEFSIPTYLCLGNHDLTEKDSLENWLTIGKRFFVDGSPNYVLETDDCMIYVMPNHWGDTYYHWKDRKAHPTLFPEQSQFIKQHYRSGSDKPMLLSTHSPVWGLPSDQTGLPRPYHAPKGNFSQMVMDLLQDHPDIGCVLGAHSHLNMHKNVNNVHFITSSSLIETPFEFKLFEIFDGTISMRTESLAKHLPFLGEYDDTRSFAQGNGSHREFSTFPRN